MPASPVVRFEPVSIHGIGASVAVHADGPRAAELREALQVAWSRCLDPADGSVTAGAVRFSLRDAGTAQRSSEAEVPGQARDDREGAPDDKENAPDDKAGGGDGGRGGQPARGDSELSSDDLATLLCTGTQTITYALIRAQVGRLLMLHAGAVSHPVTGRSLVFVAEGGTGKTTLARTLGRHYGYLTDETVGIDADNRILPYPKPLSLRTASGWPKKETSPDELGLRHPDAPATVARVIVLARDPALAGLRVRELGLLDAIQTISPQSSSLYALPQGLHRCADLIDATGPVLEVAYAEAESLLPLVEELIGA